MLNVPISTPQFSIYFNVYAKYMKNISNAYYTKQESKYCVAMVTTTD